MLPNLCYSAFKTNQQNKNVLPAGEILVQLCDFSRDAFAELCSGTADKKTEDLPLSTATGQVASKNQ